MVEDASYKEVVWYTTSWGCWKHVFGIPGVRPMFLKVELHKESKNGFKTITYRRYPTMFFSKNCFRSKKIIKKIGRFVDFWILMAIYMNNLDQFWKIWFQDFQNQLKYYQNVKNWSIFSYVTFYFWKSVFWGLEKPIVAITARKHLIFKRKSCIWKNWSVFNILVIFELILKVLKSNFSKLV